MLLTMGALYHMAPHVTGMLGAAAAARFVSIFSLTVEYFKKSHM
jgi:hypothetical protein